MTWSRRCGAICLLLVGPATAAARAELVLEQAEGVPGLAAGDRVLSWVRRAAGGEAVVEGPLDHPFDLELLEREQVPRGGVRLVTATGEVDVPRYGAKLRGEPVLPPAALDAYRQAVARLASPDEAERAEAISALGALAAETADARMRAWLVYRSALARQEGEDLEAAAAELAAAAATPGLEPLAAALLHHETGGISYRLRRPADSLAARDRGLQLLAGAAADHPVLAAQIETAIGLDHLVLGDDQESERRFAAAAVSLANHAPGSFEEARVWQNRGIRAAQSGDLALAEERYTKALTSYRALGAPVANVTNNLGIVAKTRGDMARAEELYLAAIDAQEDAGARAMYRGNLATLYLLRGELERVRDLLRELVAYYREEEPEAVFALATALGNLADAERRLGNPAAAEGHARAALAIKEERSPDALGTANTLNVLGRVLRAQERWQQAADAHARALAVAERAAPAGVLAAESHAELGAVAFARGDLDDAERRYRRALEIQRAVAPGTKYEAEWLHALGRIEAQRQRPQAALEQYLRAVDVLEGLRGHLGGGAEASAGFTSIFHELYWRPLDLLAAAGRAAEAFQLLERYRAQTLLEMLARRDLDLSLDLPAELDGERRRLGTLYDATLSRLGWATGGAEDTARRALREELDGLRRQQQEVEERIRAASPRLGAVRSPQPIDVAGAQRLLPPAALLLAYAVGPERSWVVALGPDDQQPAVVELPAGADALRGAVAEYRDRLAVPSARRGRLEMTGRRLGAMLLEPVAERLAAAGRLIVLPDGPLHLLPFAALPASTDGAPLVTRLPVSVAASMSVLAELRGGAAAATTSLVAFGDPALADAGESAAFRRAALRSGNGLGALPWSRQEVLAVGELFGDGAELFLGEEVSEEQVMAAAPSARHLHFACHAVVDPQLPLESGLVLAAPSGQGDGENGFLQVWEIYQRLRLDAEVVTLSACDTAVGREVAGEGVLGLTRAFHYAGARTVVSTLWKVADRATAELMQRFYRHLRGGRPASDALRLAQLEMLDGGGRGAGGAAMHPYYWAAFQVYGDWE